MLEVKELERVQELCCWFFHKHFLDLYLMHGDTHQTSVQEFKVYQRSAVNKLVFLGSHNLEMCSGLRKDLHRHYVPVSVFWQSCLAHRMFRKSIPTMFAYYSIAFEDDAGQLMYLIRKTTIKKTTILSLVCFI